MSVTLTTVGGRVLAFMVVTVSQTAGSVGNPITTALSLDAGVEVAAHNAMPHALAFQMNIFNMWDFGVLSAGSHTIRGRWLIVQASTTAASIGTQRRLLVVELKR